MFSNTIYRFSPVRCEHLRSKALNRSIKVIGDAIHAPHVEYRFISVGMLRVYIQDDDESGM